MTAEQVCLACGLCCDGSLFTRVGLAAGDAPSPRLRLIDGGRAFAQRCGAHEDGACVAYASRPAACRRFDCLLLGSLAEGEVDVDEALAVVAEARARIAAVAATLPAGDEGVAVMQRARAIGAGEPLARAQAWLDRHFAGQRR